MSLVIWKHPSGPMECAESCQDLVIAFAAMSLSGAICRSLAWFPNLSLSMRHKFRSLDYTRSWLSFKGFTSFGDAWSFLSLTSAFLSNCYSWGSNFVKDSLGVFLWVIAWAGHQTTGCVFSKWSVSRVFWIYFWCCQLNWNSSFGKTSSLQKL